MKLPDPVSSDRDYKTATAIALRVANRGTPVHLHLDRCVDDVFKALREARREEYERISSALERED